MSEDALSVVTREAMAARARIEELEKALVLVHEFIGDPVRLIETIERVLPATPRPSASVELREGEGDAIPVGEPLFTPRTSEARPPKHGGLCPEKMGHGPCSGCLPPDWGEERRANDALLKPTGTVARGSAGTVTVVDVAGDNTGPWKLFVGEHGVAQWPSAPAYEDPKEYALSVARAILRALADDEHGPQRTNEAWVKPEAPIGTPEWHCPPDDE